MILLQLVYKLLFHKLKFWFSYLIWIINSINKTNKGYFQIKLFCNIMNNVKISYANVDKL